VVDQVAAFGTLLMGMTLEYSISHDHKYDPVKQRDFYQLFAFFNNIDGDPETPGRDQQPPFLRLPSPEQDASLNQFESQLSAIKFEVDELKQTLGGLSAEDKASNGAATERASLTMKLKQKEEELGRLKASRDELNRTIPLALVMKERPDVRPAYILKRGAYDQPGEEVSRNTPAFLLPLESKGDLKTRLDLARWVTDKRHPLLARVTVNRVWQQFFGVGLVKTSEDFGAQGEYPSHPELLDDLANTFIDSNWNVKSLVRSIVLSQTYQQSSSVSSAAFRADAENRLLARGSRIRLDSEVIRDQFLSISGLLNNAMYGKSVKPPQPACEGCLKIRWLSAQANSDAQSIARESRPARITDAITIPGASLPGWPAEESGVASSTAGPTNTATTLSIRMVNGRLVSKTTRSTSMT